MSTATGTLSTATGTLNTATGSTIITSGTGSSAVRNGTAGGNAAVTTSAAARLPRLRRLPVPVAQPHPALRVVRDDDEVPPAQGVLALPLASPDPAGEQPAHSVEPPVRFPERTRPQARRPAEAGRIDLVPDHPPGPAGACPLPVPRTPPRPAARSAPPPGRAVPITAERTPQDFAGRRRTTSQALPEPGRWAAQFVQAAVEVTNGLRPPSQLLRWTSDDVRSMLTRRAALARGTTATGVTRATTTRSVGPRASRPHRTAVRSTRVCSPCDGVVEASAVVVDGDRVRAVALRLEGLDGRWRVTALQLG